MTRTHNQQCGLTTLARSRSTCQVGKANSARWQRRPCHDGRVDCWTCKRTAVGVCRFCGRGTCEDHTQTRAYILELFVREGIPNALVVEDALHCGRCTVRPDPVPLAELG